MKTKKIVAAVCVLVLCSKFLFGVEEAKVNIQKVEGRTEAVVSSSQTPQPRESGGGLKRTLLLPEKTMVGIAQLSSKAAGKAADAAVLGVQTVGSFLFAPVFRVLDVKKWKKESKQTP